jgi:voltage-gated potassium channel
MSIKQIIEEQDTAAGKAFDWTIQALILISIINYSIDTLPGLQDSTIKWLWYIRVFTVIVFTIEYLSRILVADRKLSYIFSFFGLIDLAAILPFYLTTGLDLRSLRAFRLLRLFRILKLVRYNAAVRRYQRAFAICKEEFVLFLGVTLITLYLAAAGIHFFEKDAQPEVFSSIFSSLWWAIVTMTTVGYGDSYPITTGGKVFSGFILLIALGVVAVPTGLIASALAKARGEEID